MQVLFQKGFPFLRDTHLPIHFVWGLAQTFSVVDDTNTTQFDTPELALAPLNMPQRYHSNSSILFILVQTCSIVLNRVRSRSIVFNHAQSSSNSLKFVQSHSILFNLIQTHSIQFNLAQSHSISLNLAHSISFNFVHSCSILFNLAQTCSVFLNLVQSRSISRKLTQAVVLLQQVIWSKIHFRLESSGANNQAALYCENFLCPVGYQTHLTSCVISSI